MAESQDPLTFIEDVAGDGILAGFDRHYLNLAVAAVEKVVAQLRAGILHALLRRAYAYGLGAVGAIYRPGAEVVMVDAVVVLVAAGIIEHDYERHAQIEFSGERAVIHAVATAINVHVAI